MAYALAFVMNLVLCLLASRRYTSREQVRRAVPGYAECESDEAFERMFERDKDTLRDMGVPLETGTNDVLFDDEIGYRLDAHRFLPGEYVSLADDEGDLQTFRVTTVREIAA